MHLVLYSRTNINRIYVTKKERRKLSSNENSLTATIHGWDSKNIYKMEQKGLITAASNSNKNRNNLRKGRKIKMKKN